MSIYTNTARFDSGRALTESELFKLAPSVFATTAHESRSDRFAPIPTIEIVRGLAKEGFGVVGAKQSLTRVAGKAPFTKHLLRIRKMDSDASYSVGDVVAEMLLKNANDGTSVYDLFAGLFRIACMNSLVANVGSIDSVKVRHTGRDVVGKVIEGTFSVVENAKLALAAPAQWSQIKMERDESLALAESARMIRFGDSDGNVDSPITAAQLLTARRRDDSDRTNLWTNFNVLQENVIRGGLHGVAVNANNVRRNMTTREIKGIDQDVKLNRALWTLADSMARMKGVTIN
jgi:Domain of unknown function (DUF932)